MSSFLISIRLTIPFPYLQIRVWHCLSFSQSRCLRLWCCSVWTYFC